MDTTGLTQIDIKWCNSASSETSGMQYHSYTEILKRLSRNDDLAQKEAKMCIGRFFYENGLDFGAVNTPSFVRMFSLFSQGMKFQIPTSHELKGWIFEDVVKEMHEHVGEIRASWADTGCSILLDEWRSANGRELVNVLVDCPKGTVYLHSYDITSYVGDMEAMQVFLLKVLDEVGIHNIVQIVTGSTSAFMKEAGKQLTDKYRHIYWTVSASYCIELMLEKLGRMDLISQTLQKAKFIISCIHSHPVALKYLRDLTDGSGVVDSSRTRSIKPFLTLENMVMNKQTLQKMFSGPMSSMLTSSTEGRRAAELVGDRLFWSDAATVLNGVIPLVSVIDWMNDSGKNHDHIGYIYETIDQAKETIKEGFKDKEQQYSPFWEVIDDVWNEFLYSPLHSAGYYLNPNIFYTNDAFIDAEVVTGLLCFVCKCSADLRAQDLITIQLEKYRNPQGAMAAGVDADHRSNISPALWWRRYGGECPELQRPAIRILSQTCDGAAKFHLRRCLAEALFLSYGKNGTDRKWLSDMVFLRYNMQLQSYDPRKNNYMVSDEIDPVDDWIAEVARNDVPGGNAGLDGVSG